MPDLLALLFALVLGLGAVLRPAYLVPPPPDDDEEEKAKGKDDEEEEEEEEEEENEEEKVSAADHKKALAAQRSKSARRFRKMESRHKADMDKIREEMGLGEDDEEEEEDEKPKGKGKGKPNVWANRARKAKDRADAAELKLAQSEARSDLRAAAKKHKGDGELLIGILGPKIRTDGDEPYVVMTIDGEKANLTLEEAVEETLQRHPRLLLSKKTPGGGGTRKPGGGRGGKAGGKSGDGPKTLEEAEEAFKQRLKDL